MLWKEQFAKTKYKNSSENSAEEKVIVSRKYSDHFGAHSKGIIGWRDPLWQCH